MIYNTSYILENNIFVENGNTSNSFQHFWIVYQFTVNQVEYNVLFFHDSSEKTCVAFKQAETCVVLILALGLG